MHNDDDTLEDILILMKRGKFLDGLKEENSPVMKMQANWTIRIALNTKNTN
jgi:hypothetical protein